MVPAANVRCNTKRNNFGSRRIEVRIEDKEFSLNNDGNKLIIVAEDGRAAVLMVAIAVQKREARGHLSDVLEERSESFEVICRHCRNVALNEAAAQRQAKHHGVDCSRCWLEDVYAGRGSAHTGVRDSSRLVEVSAGNCANMRRVLLKSREANQAQNDLPAR